MKRFTLLIAVLFLCAANVYALTAPSNVEVEATQTTLTFTWDALDSTTQANSDSLVIIDPSDSTVIATIDSVSMTSYTLTGLIPNKQYIYAVAADSAGEAFGISTPDTTTTDALAFTMSAGTNNKTDIAITISAIEDTTGIDSLCIVNMADSELVKFFLTTTTTSANISGLCPATTYSWYVADGINGNIISNGDTVTTAKVDIDQYGLASFNRGLDLARQMRLATSNQTARLDTTTITLKGTADAESTVYYQAAKYTSFDGYVSVEDSVAFTVLVYAGYAGQNDETYPWMSLVDSLNVTADGVFHKEIDFDGVKTHFMLYLRADADNSAATEVKLRLNRDNR